MSNGSLKVKIFDSKGTNVLQVAKSTLTIGSASHCDVVLKHPSVSAEHTRAWLEGGRIWVQDLGGSHGTSLNDIRLPALKPMLVRDLDTLRLGECDCTLGLEPNLVRAPVLKGGPQSTPNPAHSIGDNIKSDFERASDPPPAPSPVPPVSDAVNEPRSSVKDAELSKRKAEAEALSREVAELRLQLQMMKLEKNSAQEMTHQLQNLKNEIKNAQEQKQKWSEGLRQAELEKQQLRKSTETVLLEFKAKMLKDLATERAADSHMQESWRRDCVIDVAKQIRALSTVQVKKWATRPLSQDMIFEWEGELNSIFRQVLLGDKADTVVHIELPPIPQIPMPLPVAKAAVQMEVSDDPRDQTVTSFPVTGLGSGSGSGITKIRTLTRTNDSIRSRAPAGRRAQRKWKPVMRASLVLFAAIAALWFASSFYRRTGRTTLSSQPGDRIDVAPGQPSGAPLAPALRAPARYEPKTTRKYRGSYTENVLYLENYVAAEQNSEFRRRWLSELNRIALNDWKMEASSVSLLAFKELALIQDLNRIKSSMTVEHEQEGIHQLKAREALFQSELEAIFKNRGSVDRFLKFKRSFYVRNQAYLSKESV